MELNEWNCVGAEAHSNEMSRGIRTFLEKKPIVFKTSDNSGTVL